MEENNMKITTIDFKDWDTSGPLYPISEDFHPEIRLALNRIKQHRPDWFDSVHGKFSISLNYQEHYEINGLPHIIELGVLAKALAEKQIDQTFGENLAKIILAKPAWGRFVVYTNVYEKGSATSWGAAVRELCGILFNEKNMEHYCRHSSVQEFAYKLQNFAIANNFRYSVSQPQILKNIDSMTREQVALFGACLNEVPLEYIDSFASVIRKLTPSQVQNYKRPCMVLREKNAGIRLEMLIGYKNGLNKEQIENLIYTRDKASAFTLRSAYEHGWTTTSVNFSEMSENALDVLAYIARKWEGRGVSSEEQDKLSSVLYEAEKDTTLDIDESRAIIRFVRMHPNVEPKVLIDAIAHGMDERPDEWALWDVKDARSFIKDEKSAEKGNAGAER